ncbi:MAG: FHA domain-containing protein [Coriobacteriia bacterium]|nr:FHA domain-containing protein [Coriobacteriia bacterium]
MQTIAFSGNAAGLVALLDQVAQYEWIFTWGMFMFLLITAGQAAWVFIDSTQKRRADKALVPRIMSLVGVFFVMPAFIFKFTGQADGIRLAVQLLAEPGQITYNDAISWNVKWLIAGYGPKIALLSMLGVALGTLACILYASTVSRSRPSTEFVSALNNQFGELRQEIQSVKSRPSAPTAAATVAPGSMGSQGTVSENRRAAATVIERPNTSAATILERPGSMAELRAVSGASAGKTWKLPASESKIGRDPGNLVAIDDGKASREHARVRFADGVFTITDMGSSNGTYVNERQIAGQTPLADGDLVRIGDTTLAFKPAGA